MLAPPEPNDAVPVPVDTAGVALPFPPSEVAVTSLSGKDVVEILVFHPSKLTV